MTPTATTPANDTRVPRRSTVRTVVGVAVTGVGVVLAVSGALLLGALHGNTLRLAHTQLSTPAGAYVVDAADVRNTFDGQRPEGVRPTLHLAIDDRKPNTTIFVGVAPARDVDSYLAGTTFERITSIRVKSPYLNLNPFHSDYAGHLAVHSSRHTGSAAMPPPAAQPFWISKASGNSANLAWKLNDGTKLVIANIGPGRVAITAKLGLSLPYLYPASVAMGVLGAALTIVGIITIMRTRRSGEKPPSSGVQTQQDSSQLVSV